MFNRAIFSPLAEIIGLLGQIPLFFRKCLLSKSLAERKLLSMAFSVYKSLLYNDLYAIFAISAQIIAARSRNASVKAASYIDRTIGKLQLERKIGKNGKVNEKQNL